MNTETKSLLGRAAIEISTLKNQNKIMSAKLDMFDKCYAMFNTRPPEHGWLNSPDIVHEIQKAITEDENKVPVPGDKAVGSKKAYAK